MNDSIAGKSPAQRTIPADGFTVRAVTEVVRDLLVPKAWIFWTDLILTLAVGHLALTLHFADVNFLWQALGFVVAGMAFYRCSMFIHEVQHLREGTFVGFKIAWNLFCGIPFLIPAYTYGDHKGHHVNREYGTLDDAEYLQLVHMPLTSTIYMLSRIFWLPVVFLFRYMFLTPAAYVLVAVRHWIWKYATRAPAINVLRNRYLPSPAEEPIWKLQEAGCCIYAWTVMTLVATGVLSWTWLLHIYFLSVFIITLSHTRTLASHRFINDGREMTYIEQLLDSTTVPGHPLLTEIWGPIGLRYHALHHVVPSIPYHNIGIAHRRLMQRLEPGSPYHATLRTGLYHALSDVAHTMYRSHLRHRVVARRRRRAELAAAQLQLSSQTTSA
ncbi:MAG: fatty acid desaturase [Planctomycetia bacterium]|nr:fatty acid desaturase [Planctomycetia bacterium]